MTTSTINFDVTSSYCNSWPYIAIYVNNRELWSGYIESPQTIQVNFNISNRNVVKVHYLNKQQGPSVYDTVIDQTGNIIEDQYCIIKNIKIANSRCDFLLSNMEFYDIDGSVSSNLHGFMSKRGYYQFEFPGNIYSWILQQRKKTLFSTAKRNSSLDYWSNYIGDNDDPITSSLICEIKELIEFL